MKNMKKIKKETKLHKNNVGLTLVELITAIAILSIATGSILASFIYCTRYNAKAKTKQRATSCATTVMEYYKAYDIDDIVKDFQSGTGILVDNSAQYSFVPAGASSYPVDYVTLGIDEKNVNGTYVISGMTMSDNNSDKKCDVVIEVTKGLERSISNICVYDESQDALFKEYNESDGSYAYDPSYVATEWARKKCNARGVSTDAVRQVRISKTMNITLSDNGVTVVYVYQGYIDYKSGYSFASDSFYDDTKGASISVASPLRDVYFYFYPSYKNLAAGVVVGQDTIVINNNCSSTNTNINNVYVYKQVDASRTNAFKLTSDESVYRANGLVVSSNTNNSAHPTYVYDQIHGDLSGIVFGGVATSSYSILKDSGNVKGNHNIYIDEPNTSATNTAITSNITIYVYETKETGDLATITNKYLNRSVLTYNPIVTLTGTVVN